MTTKGNDNWQRLEKRAFKNTEMHWLSSLTKVNRIIVGKVNGWISLTTDAAETVVHAFVASRLDYCNALLYGVSDRLMRRLQSVQNAAARPVTGVPWCDHITLILQQLHWLPVRQRILFKIAVLVFQCLASQAPSYLSDDCQRVSDSRQFSKR